MQNQTIYAPMHHNLSGNIPQNIYTSHIPANAVQAPVMGAQVQPNAIQAQPNALQAQPNNAQAPPIFAQALPNTAQAPSTFAQALPNTAQPPPKPAQADSTQGDTLSNNFAQFMDNFQRKQISEMQKMQDDMHKQMDNLKIDMHADITAQTNPHRDSSHNLGPLSACTPDKLRTFYDQIYDNSRSTSVPRGSGHGDGGGYNMDSYFKPKLPWPKFEGKGRWSSFFESFKSVALTLRVRRQDLLGTLTSCINGDAREFMVDLPDSIKNNFGELVKEMSTIYDSVEDPKEYRQKLRKAQQGNRSINNFASTVYSYANRLGKNDPESAAVEAGEAFLDGVEDQTTASMARLMMAGQYSGGIPLQVALTKYQQARSALGKASDEVKSIKSLDTGTGPKYSSEESRSRRSQWESLLRARSTSPGPIRRHDHKSTSPIKHDTRPTDYRDNRTRTPSSERALANKLEYLLKTTDGRSQLEAFLKNPKSRSPSPGNCFICSKPGHRARDCSKNVARQKPRQIVCFTCNKEGHYSTSCPTGSQKTVKFEKCKFCQKQHATADCPKVAQLSALSLQQSELMSEAGEEFLDTLNETSLEETS
jgi:hypothetical protein